MKYGFQHFRLGIEGSTDHTTTSKQMACGGAKQTILQQQHGVEVSIILELTYTETTIMKSAMVFQFAA